MLVFNRKEIVSGQITRAQKSQFTSNAKLQSYSAEDFAALLVNSGISPDDAYREFDDTTVAVMNEIGEFATYFKVSSVAKSVGIGKTGYKYRKSSKLAGGVVSMSGQTGILADASEYKTSGTVIPIIDDATSREWRDQETLTADGFSAIDDDLRECGLVVFRTANNYMWNGDDKIVSPDGDVWLGLKNDPSLVQTTTAVDMASSATEPQDIVDEIGAKLDILRIDNNCSVAIDLAVSLETMSHLDRTPFSLADKTFGSLLQYIEGMRGIKSVYEDPELKGGKEFLMANISTSGLHSVVGQAMSTYMDQRTKHRDPYTWVKWMAQGFIAKSDYEGHKTALYCKGA